MEERKTTRSRPPNGRDRQREETRRRLFEEALEIFRRDGATEARIEDIAQKVGVSRGTFYLYFPTKDDVLSEVLAMAERDHLRDIDTIGPDADIHTLLITIGASMARRWEDDPRLFLEVGLMVFRRGSSQLSDFSRDPLRMALSHRFHGALATGEVVSALPAAILADSYLLSLFAAAVAWCGNPILPLQAVLEGVGALFLYGAVAREPR